jgi:hypothetical protein
MINGSAGHQRSLEGNGDLLRSKQAGLGARELEFQQGKGPNMTTQRTAALTVDGKSVEFPIMSGTHGNDVIDIRNPGGKTGSSRMTPASFTASCQSKITYIDGDKGELLYRGYPIEQLAENCNFLKSPTCC